LTVLRSVFRADCGKLVTFHQRITVIAGAVEADDAHHSRAGFFCRIQIVHCGVEIHLHIHLVRRYGMGDLAGSIDTHVVFTEWCAIFQL